MKMAMVGYDYLLVYCTKSLKEPCLKFSWGEGGVKYILTNYEELVKELERFIMKLLYYLIFIKNEQKP